MLAPPTLAKHFARVRPDDVAALFRQQLQWPQQFGQKRARLYTHEATFWLFLGQVMATGSACQKVVARFLARCAPRGPIPSANTAAYCKARQRLPQAALDHLFAGTARDDKQQGERWCGRRVKVVDGSSVSMPDTAQSQAVYPQPTGQQPGCGFPVMRLVAVFSMATGAVLAYAKGALSTHERTLFHQLWDHFEPDDVVLADRGFCSFADLHLLFLRGVDCLMRKHSRRGASSIQEKKLAEGDLLMRWRKNKVRPGWLSEEAWGALPMTLLVREITFEVATAGFRTKTITLATTMLDAKRYPKELLATLYRHRWMAELSLRDLKTTMAMEILRCKSPNMADKELTLHLIAYNLIRAVIQRAATIHGTTPQRIGFKATLATLRQWAPPLAALGERPRKQAQLRAAMLQVITSNQIPERSGRTEPRAKKRRAKNYELLTKPRHEFKETPHRSRYRAA